MSVSVNQPALTGNIFNIQKFSIHDGPGIRTTLFLKGCPLSCLWCANPESQKQKISLLYDSSLCTGCGTCQQVCPLQCLQLDPVRHKIIKNKKDCTNCTLCVEHCPRQAWSKRGERKSVDEVVEECLKDKDFYEQSQGGVTFSGGEAMLQPDFVMAVADRLHEQGISCAIETTGAVPEHTFFTVADHLDLILYDVKHYDSKLHAQQTGVGNEQILANLEKLAASGKAYLCWIPVIPDFNARLEDARGFCGLFKKLGIQQVQLLPFHQMGERKYEMMEREYTYSNQKALHPEDLKEYAKIFKASGIDAFF